MRKNLGPKTYFLPLPVLLISTYDNDGIPNIMNAAWGGIHDTNQVHLCLTASHKTSLNIKNKGCFTLAFCDAKHVAEGDYLGIESGNKVKDKVKKSGLKIEKSEFVDAPIISELPISLDCKISKSHEENDTLYIVADIINVSVNENVLDEKGKIDSSKLHIISFNPVDNTYVELGNTVGKAFFDGLKLR